MPQVIVKKRKLKEATEGLERSRRLAKQMLLLLSQSVNAKTQKGARQGRLASTYRSAASRHWLNVG